MDIKVILIGAALYYIFHSYIDSSVQKIGHSFYTLREKDQKTNQKIYDISHKYLPDLSHLHWVSDIYTFSCLIPLVATGNINIIGEYISYFILIMIIRDITTLSTILPKHKSCDLDKRPAISTFVGGCYDKMFSGHTSSVFLASLVYYKHGIITSIPILVGMNLVNILFILLGRGHYTIDVLLAPFIVLALYRL